MISSGFSVADADALGDAETELDRSGLTVWRGSAAEARSRRVREFIAFDDPFGNRVELVSQQETIARPVAFSRPAAGITEFGHLCLDAPDVHEAYRYSFFLQRQGVGLDRRRRLPHAHRPGAPQSWPCSAATGRGCAT